MDIDSIMFEFREFAETLRSEQEHDISPVLWDINCWLHRRLKDAEKEQESFREALVALQVEG